MTKRDAGLLSAAVLLGVILRILFLHDISGHLLYEALTGDPAVYLGRAHGILAGTLVPPHAFFHSCPFYPFFLALVERVFGAGLTPVRVLQAVIGVGSIPLIFVLARLTVGRTAGLVAAFLAAAYAPFIFFEAEILEITIVITAVEGCLIMLLLARRSGRAWHVATAAVLLGIASLGKPNLLLFAPFGALWLHAALRRPVKRDRSDRGRRALAQRKAVLLASLFFLVTGACVLPTTVHNWRMSGDLIPVSSNGGINLYIGNHEGAQGVFSVPPDMRFDLRVASKEAAERAAGRTLSDGEVSGFWARQAFGFISAHPGAFLGMTARKLALFWNHFEIPNHYDMNFVSDFAPVLRFSPSRFAFIAPLGLLGLALAWRDRRRVGLLILFGTVFMISVVPFFITARYRLAIVPTLLVGSGFALTWLWRMLRTRAWGALAPAVVVLALIGAAVNVRMIEFGAAPMHNTLGALLGSRGDMEGAAREFSAAVEISPTDLSARYNLGLSLLELGRPKEATQHLEAAVGIHPGYHEASLALTRAYFELGRFAEAEAAAERVLTADPPAPPELTAVAEAALRHVTETREAKAGDTEQ